MLNRFSTPLSEGFYRAVLNAALTFVVAFLTAYQGFKLIPEMAFGNRIEDAVIVGLLAALSPLVGGTLMANSDQNRANNLDSRAADVPIAAGRQ